ncbi:putative gtpase activating protein [Erysiphe neolycopersici]|uniref:GTPase-activating protein GYP5 n=1 Tax=Erysiphe neolycopersici TaxID=212602 RepID=A0A420HIK6_9PEZI|nr:putative gtpase activating protein [Erysiphe neolycopersici]
MPDLEAKIEVPYSPSLNSKNSETDQSDNETDTFEDASDASLTEPSAGRHSSTELSPSEQPQLLSIFMVDAFKTKDTIQDYPTPPPTHDIIPEINVNIESYPASPSPSTKSLSPKSSLKRICNEDSNYVNSDDITSSALNSPKQIRSELNPLKQSSPEPNSQPSSATFPNFRYPAFSRLSSPPRTLSSHESANFLTFIPALQAAQSITSPPTRTRKLTSPFLWLSRNLGKDSSPSVAPLTPSYSARRGTVSHTATNGINQETIMSNVDPTHEIDQTKLIKSAVKSNLKDRFKVLRMREEAGIQFIPDEGVKKSDASEDNKSKDASIINDESKNLAEKDIMSPILVSPSNSNSVLSSSTLVPESSGSSSSMDWDLWQSVVDEGPVAVARTSLEELNQAITTGIPNVIRGVVWQILAQSKNEELERVYRNLVARGTEKDQEMTNESSESSSVVQSMTSSNREEVITSSASSIRSEYSIAGFSIVNGLRSPLFKESETLDKVQAERKKKAQDEAAVLRKLEKTIKRDLGTRTSLSRFATSSGLQEGLFGVCKAYALYDEEVGYAQGMNFLAMPLLFNMPEDEAFCLLVRMMNQYHLRDLFIQDMPGLHMRLYQFERLLEDFEPALYCHLQRRQVTPHLYATPWFLTLFAYRFPLQLVLRIYDLILSQGLEAIIKFGIVLMQKNAAALLEISEMGALTKFLKDRLFDVYIDGTPSSGSILESGFFGSSGSSIDKEIYRADQLIRDACAVNITPELLKTYALEWEEKNKLEKQREMELEDLRLSNKNLTHKVRRLEERILDHDSEHTALATELVRTKVQNQELRDENESLKNQVDEYQDMIEKLPHEVEFRLKTEMDRLLKRNQEVHDENTCLEEEMSQMEKTLVETKMKYAEINSAHETLTRKWIDLRKALGE